MSVKFLCFLNIFVISHCLSKKNREVKNAGSLFIYRLPPQGHNAHLTVTRLQALQLLKVEGKLATPHNYNL